MNREMSTITSTYWAYECEYEYEYEHFYSYSLKEIENGGKGRITFI